MDSRPEEPVDRLPRVIDAHIAAERETLVAYHCLARAAADPTDALLLTLVLEDEERHHDLLQLLAARLRESRGAHDNSNPRPASIATAAVASALPPESIQSFLHHEREGARQLREMARQEAPHRDGLFALRR